MPCLPIGHLILSCVHGFGLSCLLGALFIIGHSIPLPCRILAVTDAYDAMTSDRSYRKALTHDEAMKEIFRNSNTQFDPDIVEIFMDLMEEGDLGII